MNSTNSAIKYGSAILLGSWFYALAFYLLGFKLGIGVIGIVMPMVYMFIPALTALILYRLEKKSAFKQESGLLFTWNRWFVVAWFGPLLFSFVILAVNVLFPDTSISLAMTGFIESQKALLPPKEFENIKAQIEAAPFHPLLLTLLSAVVAGITLNALLAFGEELFWRGVLYTQLKHLGFWKVSLITGFVWGIWHAPLIMMGHNYPHYPYLGVALMTLWTMLLTPSFTYIRQKSGSVLAPSILHGSLNASAGIPLLLIVGGSELLNGWLGASGMIALALLNIGLFIHLRRSSTTSL